MSTDTKRIAAAQDRRVQNGSSGNIRPVDRLKGLLDREDVKRRIQETMKENAGAFSSSIVELFTSDGKIGQCDPALVIAEAVKGASLKLPINKQLGFAYLVPYKDKNRGGELIPQFQLGYKGYIQLAMRSGSYKYINCDKVYEGEFIRADKLTGEIDLSGMKASDKIVGYFAYIETLNGFKKTLYMSYDEMVEHARKFSKSTYNGRLGGVWASDFDAMALKTCIRLLISKYGIMSVDMQSAYIADTTPAEQYVETPDTPDITDVDSNDAPPVNIDIMPEVDENGEVIADQEVGEINDGA